MNIKELCEVAQVDYNSNHPSYSLNKIRQIYLLEEVGKRDYKIVSKKINNTKYFNQLLIPQEQLNSAGIYKIELGKNVYIGQTSNFYKRFKAHRRGDTTKKTKIMFKSGATMSILELENDRNERFKKESKWSAIYIEKGYNLINVDKVLYKGIKHYKSIKIIKKDYEKALQILKDNNIEVKL